MQNKYCECSCGCTVQASSWHDASLLLAAFLTPFSAGVYSQGGPTVVDKRITMESLTDRTNSQSHKKRMTA